MELNIPARLILEIILLVGLWLGLIAVGYSLKGGWGAFIVFLLTVAILYTCFKDSLPFIIDSLPWLRREGFPCNDGTGVEEKARDDKKKVTKLW